MLLVISGARDSGKTTAVRRLLKYWNGPVYGFWTEKMPDGSLETPVYMHSYSAPIVYSDSNRIGSCQHMHGTGYPEVFDTLGVEIVDFIIEMASEKSLQAPNTQEKNQDQDANQIQSHDQSQNLNPIPLLVVFDEVGTMEKDAKKFQASIRTLLLRATSNVHANLEASPINIVLTMRDKSAPLLDEIRSLPGAHCISAEEANTEEFAQSFWKLVWQI